MSKLAKEIIAGQLCTLTCHLVQVENNLGRSLVIDLASKGFRQIDHRSIESIVFQNVKYLLKKGAKAEEMEKPARDEPKWNSASLAVGNWFSGTSYFQAVDDKGDEVVCKMADKAINISKDILEYEMHNANVFAEE